LPPGNGLPDEYAVISEKETNLRQAIKDGKRTANPETMGEFPRQTTL